MFLCAEDITTSNYAGTVSERHQKDQNKHRIIFIHCHRNSAHNSKVAWGEALLSIRVNLNMKQHCTQ